jgi:hypothetical protein
MKKFLYLTLLVGLLSCDYTGYVVNKEWNSFPNHCTLVFKGIKEFPLDDQASYYTDYLQFMDRDTVAYFSFFNRYNNAVYLYDYASSEFIQSISYEKEGGNGVGEIAGYCYVNSDSIYVYTSWAQLLYLTDSHARVLSKNKIEDGTHPGVSYPAPDPATDMPLKKYGNYIIAVGLRGGETVEETPTNRPVGIVFNLETQLTDYIINYPEQYSKYNWGAYVGRKPYYDLANESMIVSFPAHHYVIAYSLLTGTQIQHYAGSAAVKKIPSFPERKHPNLDNDKVGAWDFTSPLYRGIFYDKYKKMYYRICRLPKKDYQIGDRSVRKPIVIIVLDENLKYLGEVALPTDGRFRDEQCFVSEDGFNIQVLTGDEDKMTFYCYNFLVDEE